MEAIAEAGTAPCGQRQSENRALGLYQRRRPAETVLYQLMQEYLETFLALADDPTGPGLHGYVERDFRKYLDCGILARGFARVSCEDCGEDHLIAFSCKARGACPSCNTRRMVEIAAHLVDHVVAQVPVRPWVLSLPKRLRGFLHRDPALAGRLLRIFLEEVERALRRQCPDAGAKAHRAEAVPRNGTSSGNKQLVAIARVLSAAGAPTGITSAIATLRFLICMQPG